MTTTVKPRISIPRGSVASEWSFSIGGLMAEDGRVLVQEVSRTRTPGFADARILGVGRDALPTWSLFTDQYPLAVDHDQQGARKESDLGGGAVTRHPFRRATPVAYFSLRHFSRLQTIPRSTRR